jgi:hypothetical protein
MQHVRGEYVIFADADGASKFDDLGKLAGELKLIERESLGVAVGSRAHMVHSAAVVQVSTLENITNKLEIIHSKFHHVRISYLFASHWRSVYQRHAMWIQIIHSESLCNDFPGHAC